MGRCADALAIAVLSASLGIVGCGDSAGSVASRPTVSTQPPTSVAPTSIVPTVTTISASTVPARPPSGPSSTGRFGPAVLTLSKSSGLGHGEAVDVTGSGFGPMFGQITPHPLVFFQCRAQRDICTLATGYLQPDTQGTVRGRAVLTRMLIGGGQIIDCAEAAGRCVFATVGGQPPTSPIPLTFLGGDPPPGPGLHVDPTGEIGDGAVVTVTTSNLPPFGIASLARCSNDWSVLDSIPLDGVSCNAVGEVWHENLSGTPSRTAIRAALSTVIPGGSNYGLPTVDCRERPGRCSLLLVFNETVIGEVELDFA